MPLGLGPVPSACIQCRMAGAPARPHATVVLPPASRRGRAVRASIPSNSLRLPESRLDNYGLRRTRTHMHLCPARTCALAHMRAGPPRSTRTYVSPSRGLVAHVSRRTGAEGPCISSGSAHTSPARPAGSLMGPGLATRRPSLHGYKRATPSDPPYHTSKASRRS